MPTFPSAPADLSGGIVRIGITNGEFGHVARVHVPIIGGASGASPFAWSLSAAHGVDSSILDVATNFITKIKPYYYTDWSLFVLSLERVTAGVATPLFPTTSYVASGTGSLALAAGDPRSFNVRKFDFQTANGGRFSINLAGAGPTALQAPAAVTGSSGGYTGGIEGDNSPDTHVADRALVAYITGGNGVIGHDGAQLVGTCKMSVYPSRRLRARYGFS